MSDQGPPIVPRAFFQVQFDGGGVPSYTTQSGDLLTTITDNGAGDITIEFAAGMGIPSARFAWAPYVNGALAASQLTTFGIVHVSDEQKRITILREGGGGAVSALTDVAFGATVFEILSA